MDQQKPHQSRPLRTAEEAAVEPVEEPAPSPTTSSNTPPVLAGCTKKYRCPPATTPTASLPRRTPHPPPPLPLPHPPPPHHPHQPPHTLTSRRHGPHHRSNPPPTLRREPLHRNDLLLYQLRPAAIALVHHKNIRDLHHPGLETLHLITHPRHQHQHRHIGQPNHIHLILPHPHCLNQNHSPPRRLHHRTNIPSRLRYPTHRPPRSHTPDKHPIIRRKPLHSNPVTQQRPTCIRTRRIHRHHADTLPLPTQPPRHLIHQR